MPHLNSLYKRVLILGGYGTFGARIAELLASEHNVQLIIAGRDRVKAEILANQLQIRFPSARFEGLRLDHEAVNFTAQLAALNLDLLIHCAGPFQAQGYHVAEACIASHTAYIDIADAGDFVCNIETLDHAAREADTVVISGASSLPALSSAAIQRLAEHFDSVNSIEIDITPAHRISRGLATVRSGFEALGKPFVITREGQPYATFAGDELRRVNVGHPVGNRWVCNFDVADLHLAPAAIPQVRNLRFGTGVQPRPLQIGLAICAQLARIKLPDAIPPLLTHLAKAGHWLAARWPGGSPHGGMQVKITGATRELAHAESSWHILGLNGDGPWIPAAPAAAMARKILRNEYASRGARPCWQLVELEQILEELTPFAVVSRFDMPQSAR
ncbi:saccharopine dehydrogenase NADP-binding domain-containing protein [Microbulbifer sp. SA54]|uniref:saccharopine dehydrogenase family protein n=1 Tax=Microbulbifer sp. SA54 TaxID=3401577 RepID=UPI003AB05FC8